MAEEGDELEGDEDGGPKGLTGKKIVLFIVLPLLLLTGAGVGVTAMLGVFSEPPPPPETEEVAPQPWELEPNLLLISSMVIYFHTTHLLA